MSMGQAIFLLTWSLLVIHHGSWGKLEKIAQQPNNVLADFIAYRHISIVHFKVPENAVTASFK